MQLDMQEMTLFFFFIGQWVGQPPNWTFLLALLILVVLNKKKYRVHKQLCKLLKC